MIQPQKAHDSEEIQQHDKLAKVPNHRAIANVAKQHIVDKNMQRAHRHKKHNPHTNGHIKPLIQIFWYNFNIFVCLILICFAIFGLCVAIFSKFIF